MTYPAAVEDLESRWRPLSDQESANASAFLDDAWDLLLSRRPSLPEDLIAERVREQSVTRVLCAMVLRLLRNPEGWDQESIDDWSGRRHQLVADGLLKVTDDELADISPGRRRRRSVRLVKYDDA